MPDDDTFINPVERSLLTDLVGLYTCDLTREPHQFCREGCIACSKLAIVHAIDRYRKLDADARVRAPVLAPLPNILTG